MSTAAKTRRADPVGVHYTPSPVVDYMVRRALDDVRLANVPTILDPSCGDGAFLGAAYRRLLEHQGLGSDDAPARVRLLRQQIFGVDVDPLAVQAARLRLARLALGEKAGDQEIAALADALASQIKAGNAVFGPEVRPEIAPDEFLDEDAFDWRREFPQPFAAPHVGFGVILGNPPYRRERGFRAELARIAQTSFGRRCRSARMDLWYYFLHRSLDLLQPGGRLAFIVSAYWLAGRGAEKLIDDLRQRVAVEEIFLLGKTPVFPGVSGQHLILQVVGRTQPAEPVVTQIRQARDDRPLEEQLRGTSPPRLWCKPSHDLFREGRVDLAPPPRGREAALAQAPTLSQSGLVRQGIAENPASINRRTNERFGRCWIEGEGVFSLAPAEAQALELSPREAALLRPYHDFADVGRHRCGEPSRRLIYATRETWPRLEDCPRLAAHLARFRPALEARREVRRGTIGWWHLHWPRAESLWNAPKVLAPQFGARPAFVAAPSVCYVPFSVNVFVPHALTQTWELDFLAGVLNARLLWDWFERHAKRRGSGLEINGHVLARAPLRPLSTLDEGELGIARQIGETASRIRQGQIPLEACEEPLDAWVAELFAGLPRSPR